MAKEGKPEAEKAAGQPDSERDESRDPDELQDGELDQINGGNSKITLLTNLLNMQHEMLKGIAKNLRS